MNERKAFEVWGEGYTALGRAVPAALLGVADAKTFVQACHIVLGDLPEFDCENLTYWGCQLFSNELDARKSHG